MAQHVDVVRTHPLAAGSPPPWASGWGHDRRFGPWVTLSVQGFEQRMRWIPPGSFQMGSVAVEPNRGPDELQDAHEQPAHLVTLTRGFWIFDTPCTQALWQAVLGDNPSQFAGALRPVENVSWDDVQRFLAAVNRLLPAIQLALPSEAQWEHACRAGTAGSRYAALDDVAWYNGNSGQQSHDVGQKQPNPWGLYDTLGNVFEWCRDVAFRKYPRQAQYDPVQEIAGAGTGVSRVIRGGSWNASPSMVRAAAGGECPQADARFDLGFRAVAPT